MTIPKHSTMSIPGEYLDSFVYSGTLFLVGVDRTLTTYSWNELVDSASNKSGKTDWRFRTLLKGGQATRQLLTTAEKRNEEVVEIEESALKNCRTAKLDLEDWPSDISVYANKLYTASDKGVWCRRFAWSNGLVREFEAPAIIWPNFAYGISPNSLGRIAVAGGNDGLWTVVPHGNAVYDEDSRQVVGHPCSSCDWQEGVLVASTTGGAFRAEFAQIPQSPTGEGAITESYRAEVNKVKRQPPTVSQLNIHGAMVLQSWIGGDRLFALTGDFRIYAREESVIGKNETPDSFVELTSVPIAQVDFTRTPTVRSGIFGSLIENGKQLSIISEEGLGDIASEPGRWRVFPRAKNYANQVHIAEELQLRILAFDPPQTQSSADRFGFSIESITASAPNASN